MGSRFNLEYTNVVVYLTAPGAPVAPRLTKQQLREFLGSVRGGYRDRPPLIASDPRRIGAITEAAEGASRVIEDLPYDDGDWVPPPDIKDAFATLRKRLGDFDFFGVGVGTNEDREGIEAFLRDTTYSSRHQGLFLIPDFSPTDIHLLDPFPQTALLAEQPENWPGVLFWTRLGGAALVPMEDARELCHELLPAPRVNMHSVEDALARYARRAQNRKILHLSDLHFGTDAARENEASLAARVEAVARTVGRSVITGDVFDHPRDRDAKAIRGFFTLLGRAGGKDPIVVPGNHDQAILGNSSSQPGRRVSELAKLEWTQLAVDEAMECIFFCFDSSRNADPEKGNVSKEQLREMDTLFKETCAHRPEVKQYLRIALLHHHPFSFQAEKETVLPRSLAFLARNEKYFVRMQDAETFLSWCAKRNIPLVLHGHKHVQRYIRDLIGFSEGERSAWREVTAVGCGTSSGVDGKPLAFNLLVCDARSGRWGVSFFADPGDGSGFSRQCVTLQSAKETG